MYGANPLSDLRNIGHLVGSVIQLTLVGGSLADETGAAVCQRLQSQGAFGNNATRSSLRE
jgi:hypothetical protein